MFFQDLDLKSGSGSGVSKQGHFKSLVPGRFEHNFRQVIFKLISVTDDWGIFCKIALRWMPLDLTDDKSTLIQVMAWCRQATSHYLSQCLPRFMPPYGVTRPQWVMSMEIAILRRPQLPIKWGPSRVQWCLMRCVILITGSNVTHLPGSGWQSTMPG